MQRHKSHSIRQQLYKKKLQQNIDTNKDFGMLYVLYQFKCKVEIATLC
jgi:hypothetical protein